MTIRDRIATAHSTSHDEWPTFDLRYQFDDEDDPAEVTVFVDEPDNTTAWVTADIETAVSLGDVR